MSQSYHRFGTISQSLHLTTFEFKIVFNTEKEVWPKLTQNRLFTKDDVDVGANHFCRRKNEAALAQETDNEQPTLAQLFPKVVQLFPTVAKLLPKVAQLFPKVAQLFPKVVTAVFAAFSK